MHTPWLMCLVFLAGFTVSNANQIDDARFIQSLFCENNTCSSQNNIILNDTISNLLNDLPVQQPPFIYRDCCGPCSCDVNYCRIEGTCCLDVLEYLPTVEESLSTIKMSCEYPQLRPYVEHTLASAPYSLRMIRRCNNRNLTILRQKCENPAVFDDILTKIPVVDKTSFLSYQNRFCALCNDVEEDKHVNWNLKITCITGFFKPTDISTLTIDIYNTEDCNLIYDVPLDLVPGLTVPECKKVITSCNETGLWKHHNALIEDACLAYETVYDYRYRNAFCYMCNTGDDIAPELCLDIPGFNAFITFAALLKLPDTTETEVALMEDLCDEYHIHDPVLVSCVLHMGYSIK